jgi:hypothetical protein
MFKAIKEFFVGDPVKVGASKFTQSQICKIANAKNVNIESSPVAKFAYELLIGSQGIKNDENHPS